MKIALINPPLIGHEKRGTGIYSKNLLSELGSFPDLNIISAEAHQLPRDVDLYHFPYFDPFFLTLPPIRFKKTIVTIHDLIPLKFPEYFPRGVKGELKWQIQKLIVKNVDAVITDSVASANDIHTFISLAHERIFSIPLAPAQSFLKSKEKNAYQYLIEKYQLPNKFIIYVGDMNWNKNIVNIIKAATKVHIPLVIVSKAFLERHDANYNPWKESLIEAQRLTVNNPYIYKVGHIGIEELVGMYKLAICLVFPSFYEGFGLPVVEAFAAGCPVITSDRGSLKEIIGNAALIVDPANTEMLASAILRMAHEQNLRKQLMMRGKERVKFFSWKKTAEETLEVYKKVLRTK